MNCSKYNSNNRALAFDVLSTLTIEKILGSGAYGTVFLVRNKIDGDLYALKVLDKCGDETSPLNELKVLLKIGAHGVPFTTKLYASFQTSEYAFFLMKYFPGGTLARLVESHGPLSEARAMEISSQILIALEQLHSIGVSHCDLKPDNVLIDRDGTIAIADFGISDLENSSVQKQQTNEGALQLWSPELGKGAFCTGASVDLWSFGLMLHYMISGKFPFSDFVETENNKRDAFVSPASPGKVSEKLVNLIRSLLDGELCSRLVDIGEIKKHPWYNGVSWNTTNLFFQHERTTSESVEEMDLICPNNNALSESTQLVLKAPSNLPSMRRHRMSQAFQSEVNTKTNLADRRPKGNNKSTGAMDSESNFDDYWIQKIRSCNYGIEAIDFFSYSPDDKDNVISSFDYLSSDIKHFLDQRFCMVRI